MNIETPNATGNGQLATPAEQYYTNDRPEKHKSNSIRKTFFDATRFASTNLANTM